MRYLSSPYHPASDYLLPLFQSGYSVLAVRFSGDSGWMRLLRSAWVHSMEPPAILLIGLCQLEVRLAVDQREGRIRILPQNIGNYITLQE
jgi:hypothetical protein